MDSIIRSASEIHQLQHTSKQSKAKKSLPIDEELEQILATQRAKIKVIAQVVAGVTQFQGFLKLESLV